MRGMGGARRAAAGTGGKSRRTFAQGTAGSANQPRIVREAQGVGEAQRGIRPAVFGSPRCGTLAHSAFGVRRRVSSGTKVLRRGILSVVLLVAAAVLTVLSALSASPVAAAPGGLSASPAFVGTSPAHRGEFYTVVRHIAPIMEKPGPYVLVEDGRGVEDQEGIAGCIYYGGRVAAAPAPEAQWAADWMLLLHQGRVLGYVEKNALAPFPRHTPLEPEPFSAAAERLSLFLLPGSHPVRDYSDFYLPRGVTVTGVGELVLGGETWVLLRFSSFGVYGDGEGGDSGAGDVHTRYAWVRARELLRLRDYAPDLSRVDEARLPGEMMEWQWDGGLGAVPLDGKTRRLLLARGFAVRPEPLLVENLMVDDLVDAYPTDPSHVVPLFLTADLGLHTFHLLFDRMLQKVEERHFAPLLAEFLGRLDAALAAREGVLAGSARGREVVDLTRDYLAVARALLAGGEGGDAPLVAAVPPLGERARTEYDRILAAADVTESTLTGRRHDYTLYKPRGHYTLSPALSRYFRAMSLLGGLTFPLKGAAGEDEAVLRNTGVIAVLCSLLEDPEIRQVWKRLFDPFTYLVGASNDNSWYDFGPVTVRNFAGLPLGDEAALRLYNRALLAAARPPLIVGVPAPRTGASQEEREEDAVGFRFIGRRFTFDALVFNMLTAPQTGSEELPRNLPDPLDVMAVLGSPAALGETGAFARYARYAENQAALRKRWLAFGDDPLSRNVYSDLLHLFSDYFAPTEGGQFFSRAPEWEYKKLVTASAAWAELKHDTILYGEQSGAEMGDGGDVWYAPDYLFPEPRGYVEPAPRLFAGLARAAGRVRDFLAEAGWDDEEYSRKLETFAGLMGQLADIAGREVRGEPLGSGDFRVIREFPAALDRDLLFPEDMSGLYPPYMEDVVERLRMALTADVATDYFEGRVLYVATGAPKVLHVFVDDRWGGPRVTRGAVFSFYSFDRPLSEGRLSDEEWKEMVYRGDPAGLDALRPDWTRRPEK